VGKRIRLLGRSHLGHKIKKGKPEMEKEKRKRGNESYEKTAIFFHFLPFSFSFFTSCVSLFLEL